MSYEPTIIINHTQLQAHREYIEKMGAHIGKHTIKSDGYAALVRALDYRPITFQVGDKDLQLVLVDIEFTKRNAEVRKLLTAMEIEFREWN